MSLHITLFGLSCGCCGYPAWQLHVYVNAILTEHEHEPGYGPDCMYWISESPVGGVADVVPHTPAPSASLIGAA